MMDYHPPLNGIQKLRLVSQYYEWGISTLLQGAISMKGVILAGGTGSRLYPLTKVTNKHLLRVGHEPMIYYLIKKLTQAGITDILIVTGVEHMGDVVGLLGSGKSFNCNHI